MTDETRPRYRALPDPRAGTVEVTESGLTISVPDGDAEILTTGPYTLSQDNSSPAFQRDAIRAQLERLREHRLDEIAFSAEAAGSTYGEVIGTGAPDMHRMQGVDAHFLLVAIGAVLRTSAKLLSRTGDPRLAEARTKFDAAYPHAADLRDIHEHLEDYAAGDGWLQRDDVPESVRVRSDGSAFWIKFEDRSDPDCAIWINFSDSRRVELRAAAAKAVEMAELMEQVESEYVERTGH
jgi:hypothetical protein